MKVRKKFLSLALALVMVLSLLPVTAVPVQAAELTDYWTDSGNISEVDPPYDSSTRTYTISTAAELAWLANWINDIGSPYGGLTFKLGADIDLAGHFWVPIGTFSPTQKYFGYIFDGNGKTISNMTIGTTSSPSTLGEVGLFGFANEATFKDVNITNISIYADLGASRIAAGGIVGLGYGCTISGVSVSGVLSARSTSSYSGIGGAAGVLYGAGMSPDYTFNTVENSTSTVSIISSGTYMSAAGLIGHIEYGNITNCYSTQDILAAGAKYAGGLIGFASYSGIITDSYALGNVLGSNDTDAGGLIGHSYFDVESCFALGNVTGGVSGGLIGYGRTGNINNSFALGNAYSSGVVGGLVGISSNDGLLSIINCYAVGDIETTQTMTVNQYAGGLVGGSFYASTIIDNAYWNSDAIQTVNLVNRDTASKRGVDRIPEVSTAKSQSEMTDVVFATLLNENKGDSRSWTSVDSINNGYPYLEGLYYTTPTYTATFDSQGGSVVDPIIDIVHYATITLPAAPTKEGFVFGGWNTAEAGTGTTFDGTTPVTANITVYAQWAAETYTVTFNSNGGSEVDPIADIAKDATVALPAAPTKEGFVFVGWNTAEAGTGTTFDGTTTVTANITVYAQWTAETYTVTFNSNGGSEVDPIAGIAKDATVTLPAAPTKAGFVFAGWNTAEAGTGTTFDGTTTVTANITVYAQWTAETYTLIFNSNGGSEVDPIAGIAKDATVTLPVAPTKAGFVFAGWNTAEAGTGTTFDGTTPVTANITVYAQWTAETYTVTFNSNGGSEVDPIADIAKDATVTLPTAPTKAGFVFGGWFTDDTTFLAEFTAETPVTANITVYAQWTAETYTVTFNSNGGSEVDPIADIAKDATVTLPAAPTKAGFVFVGWNTAEAGTGTAFDGTTTVTANITVYAQWTAETYTVTFNSNGGSEVDPIADIAKDATVTLPTAPTKAGFVFAGWNTAEAGTGTTFDGTTTVTANITVYAQWTAVPTTTPEPNAPTVSYQTHVQDVGWQDYVSNGAVSGTSAQSKRLEAIRIKLVLQGINGGIEYRTHVQDIGWQDWVANNSLSGTSGQGKRLEAIEIRLTGEAATLYDVYYRVHVQDTGCMDWAKDGESSGTAGYSYRLETIEIKLVAKGEAAPGATAKPFIDRYAPTVSYKTHVQDFGWQDYVSNGAESGTSGLSKRLEGIQIKLENIAGGVEYSTHIQDIGWQSFVENDAISGTSGQSKRLEAIKIRLTGEAAEAYDIYYCVHAQNTGWLDWAKNGQSAGTAGFGYRLEAIKVILVPKGGPAPGATARAFVQS